MKCPVGNDGDGSVRIEQIGYGFDEHRTKALEIPIGIFVISELLQDVLHIAFNLRPANGNGTRSEQGIRDHPNEKAVFQERIFNNLRVAWDKPLYLSSAKFCTPQALDVGIELSKKLEKHLCAVSLKVFPGFVGGSMAVF